MFALGKPDSKHLGFEGHTVSATAIQLRTWSMKAVLDNEQTGVAVSP